MSPDLIDTIPHHDSVTLANQEETVSVAPPVRMLWQDQVGDFSVTMTAGALLRLVQRVKPAIAHRPTLPSLSHVLLDTRSGALRVCATNLSIGLEATASEGNVTPGQIAVPFTPFETALKAFDTADLVVISMPTPDRLIVQIACGPTRIALSIMDPGEYPLLPSPEERVWLTLDTRQLHDLCGPVVYAAMSDETRPIYQSIHVAVREHEVSAVACDTYRLAVSQVACDPAGCLDVNIPVTSVETLLKLLPKPDHRTTAAKKGRLTPEIVQFHWATRTTTAGIVEAVPNLLVWRWGQMTMWTHLNEGQYPEWRTVMTPQTPHETVLLAISPLRKAFAMIPKSSAATTMQITATTEQVVMTYTDDTDHLDFTWTFPVLAASPRFCPVERSQPRTYLFNLRYFDDMLSALTSPTALIGLQDRTFDERENAYVDGTLPVIVLSPETHAQYHVIMPLYRRG